VGRGVKKQTKRKINRKHHFLSFPLRKRWGNANFSQLAGNEGAAAAQGWSAQLNGGQIGKKKVPGRVEGENTEGQGSFCPSAIPKFLLLLLLFSDFRGCAM
jgi:hypothetical protein